MSKYFSKSVGGFVDPIVMGKKMPADAVELTFAQYDALMSGQLGGGIAHDADGVPAVVDPAASLTLDQVKARKLAELAGACATRLDSIKAGYPIDEVQSWPKQESEARAYVANQTAPTPLLSAMSTARGITLADLVARVIANADAWAATGGAIIGKRQRYEDAVAAASDAAAVQAIEWVD